MRVWLDWGRAAPGGLLSAGPGEGRDRSAPRPRHPRGGRARYGWCQNRECQRAATASACRALGAAYRAVSRPRVSVSVRLRTLRCPPLPNGDAAFHTSQFVVATCSDTAQAGTFTSLPEHYAEWKTTAPVPEKDVGDLGVAGLASQQRLVAGEMHSERLINPSCGTSRCSCSRRTVARRTPRRCGGCA